MQSIKLRNKGDLSQYAVTTHIPDGVFLFRFVAVVAGVTVCRTEEDVDKQDVDVDVWDKIIRRFILKVGNDYTSTDTDVQNIEANRVPDTFRKDLNDYKYS